MTDRQILEWAFNALSDGYEGARLHDVLAVLRDRLAEPESVIQARKEGDLIVVDLPQVPRGSGGITKDEQLEPEQLVRDLITHGMAISKGGERIDPTSIYKQPEQEPVAWISHNAGLYHGKPDESLNPLPLYTAPPQREWIGLTKEEYEAMAEKCVTNCYFDTLKYARAIEARLRDKNS